MQRPETEPAEIFPLTQQELVVWKLTYSDPTDDWRLAVATHAAREHSQYTAVEAEASMTKWLIELERAIPGTVVYSKADAPFELDIAIEVAGVPIGLLWHRYFEQIAENAHRLSQGDARVRVRNCY
jgi:hypothetical protein